MNYPFKKVIVDIKNYFYLRKTIKNNLKTTEWEKFRLRVDWIGRIYTVINLPPEVIHSPDAPQEIRPAYILEDSKPINEYLTKLNLQEIVVPEISPITNSFSYLLLYRPYFQVLSWKWFFLRVFVILVLICAHHKFDVFNIAFEIIKKAYEFML